MRSLSNHLVLQTVSMVAMSIGQAQAQQTPVQPAATENNESVLSEVVVTGSRLGQRDGFSAPTPVTVLGAESLQQQSPGSVLDVLNQMPMFANTSSTTAFQGYTRGINAADLRGLGNVRTLVLMNGRRLPPRSGDGVVDTNVIPASLIQRVDVVTGGASAAYGSDAVAGVVNFILNDRLEGMSAQYHYGEDAFGGSEEHSMQLAAGMPFADGRGHFIFGADAMTNDGVGDQYTRKWTRDEEGLVVLGANRPAGLPSRIVSDNVEYSLFTPGGLIIGGPLDGIAFGPGGEPYPFERGLVGGTSMISPDQVNYGYSHPLRRNALRSPLDRVSTLARTNFEISDNLNVWANAGYAYVGVKGFRVADQPEANLIIHRDNPFLPDSIRQQMIANGLTTFRMARVTEEVAGALTDTTNKQWMIAAGVEGQFGDGWSWDLSLQHGRSRFLAEISEVPRRANLYAALNAVRDPATGNIVCGPLATNPMLNARTQALVDPGCVPANPFGPGSFSEEARAYITGPEPGQSPLNRYRQDVAELNVQGSPFSTWAGPFSIAAGAGWRRDHSEYTVTNSMPNTPEEGRYFLGNFVPYEGTKTTKEFYTEVGVPLLSEQPFAESLDLNGAIRVTDYSTSGTVETWKVGLTYKLKDIRLRGTRSRDIRAPNLVEDFATTVSGITPDLINRFNGQSAATQTQGVRGIGLTPEIADTWTAGIVLNPSWVWLDGLTISADYFDIKVTDVIGALPAQDVVDRCFAGQENACERIDFDPTAPNGIAMVGLGPINSARLATKGVDLEASYDVPLPNFISGQMILRGLATYTDSWITTTGAQPIDRVGQQVPKWNWNANLGYSQGGFSGNAIVTGFSNIYYDTTLIGPGQSGYDPSLPNSISKNEFPSAAYLTLAARYDFNVRGTGTFEVFTTVSNVLDKRPPDGAGVFRLSSFSRPYYDYIGPVYKAGVKISF